MKHFILFLFAGLISLHVSAQVTITGTVTDKKSGQPVIGAVVIAKGNPGINAITGPGGKYRINLPAGVTTLEVMSRDYNPSSQGIGNKTVIDFKLSINKGKAKGKKKTPKPKK
jgi:hypothetical protein